MGDCKILWSPKNEVTRSRGPGLISYRGIDGKIVGHVAKKDENGNWIFDLPLPAAQFALTQEPSKYFLLEPAELTVNRGSLLEGVRYEQVKAVRLPTAQRAAESKPAKAQKAAAPAPLPAPAAGAARPPVDDDGFGDLPE